MKLFETEVTRGELPLQLPSTGTNRESLFSYSIKKVPQTFPHSFQTVYKN